MEKGTHSDYQGALSDFLQGLELAKARNDKQSSINFSNYIGSAYYRFGDYHKALDYYSQSPEIARKIGDRIQMGAILLMLWNDWLNASSLNSAFSSPRRVYPGRYPVREARPLCRPQPWPA